MNPTSVFDTVMADNGTVSAAVSMIGGVTPIGVLIPSGWATGNLTFSIAYTVDGTYYPVYSADGTVYTIPSAVASSYYALDPTKLAGASFLKLTSSVSQTGGPLTLKVHGRRLG